MKVRGKKSREGRGTELVLDVAQLVALQKQEEEEEEQGGVQEECEAG